jgi:hypothetical protein
MSRLAARQMILARHATDQVLRKRPRPPLSVPAPFQTLQATPRMWLRKMENVRLRIYLGLPEPPPPGPSLPCMPPFLPPFMAPFMPPAPPPVPLMSPLARI